MCNNDELITSRQIAAMSIDHVLSNNLLTLSLILTEIIYYMLQVFFFFFLDIHMHMQLMVCGLVQQCT